ncbi:hypothetical protein QUV83_03425 [Cellulomonas cellasea]|uniref:hypothetical protein n=1 Tax=Cellulomonas cellasea TaxID=43670 RepID=UPI0025A3516D|nr:hypothetical protein [Cellulomonas cellasea]MDM8083815.1 hypothetical protein [Cellulomonas cellasea]
MVKPSAPLLATGLLLTLLGGFFTTLAAAAQWGSGAAFVGAFLGGVGTAVLVVGVYRLASNVDAAAGLEYAPSAPAPVSDDERSRQAAARRALARD